MQEKVPRVCHEERRPFQWNGQAVIRTDRNEESEMITSIVICKTTNKVRMEGLACQRMGRGARNQGEEGRGRKIMCAQLCQGGSNPCREELKQGRQFERRGGRSRKKSEVVDRFRSDLWLTHFTGVRKSTF